jgi:hypothetical protein
MFTSRIATPVFQAGGDPMERRRSIKACETICQT